MDFKKELFEFHKNACKSTKTYLYNHSKVIHNWGLNPI